MGLGNLNGLLNINAILKKNLIDTTRYWWKILKRSFRFSINIPLYRCEFFSILRLFQWWHVMNTCICVMCNIVYCVEEFVKSLHKKVEIQDILVPISAFEVNQIWPPFLLIKIKILTLWSYKFVKNKSVMTDFLALQKLWTGWKSPEKTFFLKRVKKQFFWPWNALNRP